MNKIESSIYKIIIIDMCIFAHKRGMFCYSRIRKVMWIIQESKCLIYIVFALCLIPHAARTMPVRCASLLHVCNMPFHAVPKHIEV